MKTWKELWEQAVPHERFIAADEKHGPRWREIYDACTLTPEQRERLGGFVRPMRLLTLAGVWCGDCVTQVPLIERLAEACERLEHRVIAIEEVEDEFKERWAVNGGHRVPVMFVLSEDWHLADAWGDRTLGRYRMLRDVKRAAGPDAAREQYYAALSAESKKPEVISRTAGELLDEIERMQILFQLSPRLIKLAGEG